MYKVYLISSHHSDNIYYKIGFTRRDPKFRIKELSTGNSHELELVTFFESKWGPKIESNLHKRFNSKRCEGEWFLLSHDDVSNFENICERNHEIFEYISKENSWARQSKEFSKYL